MAQEYFAPIDCRECRKLSSTRLILSLRHHDVVYLIASGSRKEPVAYFTHDTWIERGEDE